MFLITITTKSFTAKVHVGIKADTPLEYMKTWGLEKIVACCKREGWACSVKILD